MTHTNLAYLLLLTVTISLTGLIAGYVGNQMAERKFADLYYKGLAVELKTRIAIIEKIRHGDTEKAIKILVSLIDVK
ncbi:MAG: hypothetical protein ACE5HM_01360 [Acidiferrobacterales bacterium]